MIDIYVDLIMRGEMTLDDVPDEDKDAVRAKLIEKGVI